MTHLPICLGAPPLLEFKYDCPGRVFIEEMMNSVLATEPHKKTTIQSVCNVSEEVLTEIKLCVVSVLEFSSSV